MLETAAEAHKFKEQTMIKADDHLKLQKVASTFNEITTKNSNWSVLILPISIKLILVISQTKKVMFCSYPTWKMLSEWF